MSSTVASHLPNNALVDSMRMDLFCLSVTALLDSSQSVLPFKNYLQLWPALKSGFQPECAFVCVPVYNPI